jgi:molybdenum cofactor biosynthesis protein B
LAPAQHQVRVAIVTVSDTRTVETDEGGRLIRRLCDEAGFSVLPGAILPDEPAQVLAHVEAVITNGHADAILLTGGTGVARRDTTVEALAKRFDKTLDGFGELFRMLSFAEVGPAAMLSRATAGTIGQVAVFLMPGSPKAVALAMSRLIVPELGHIVAQLGAKPATAGDGASAGTEPGQHGHDHGQTVGHRHHEHPGRHHGHR